jgi:hypothetical protein
MLNFRGKANCELYLCLLPLTERQPIGGQAAPLQFVLRRSTLMDRDFALHSAILSPFVATGLDPVVHADSPSTAMVPHGSTEQARQ